MPYTHTHPGIDTGLFTTDQASGGSSGSPKTFIKLDKGAVMTKIQAWKDDWRIRGVEMWMSDGTSMLLGSRNGSSSYFQVGLGELITRLNVQASGETSSGGYRRLGALYMETDQGRSWGIYSKNLKEEGRYWPDCGSGIVCGMFGAAGDDVDSLGFAILLPIKMARLVNVTYPNLDMQVVANTPTTVAEQTFTNGTTVDQSFTLMGKKTVTTERSWSETTGFEGSMSTTVTAGIPEVASASGTASWAVSNSTTQERSSSVTEEQSWSWPIICPAGRKVHGIGTMYADQIDTKYEAQMHIDLMNGRVYEYYVEGIYDGMNVRTGDVTITDEGPA